jgi:hypothetical protein
MILDTEFEMHLIYIPDSSSTIDLEFYWSI